MRLKISHDGVGEGKKEVSIPNNTLQIRHVIFSVVSNKRRGPSWPVLRGKTDPNPISHLTHFRLISYFKSFKKAFDIHFGPYLTIPGVLLTPCQFTVEFRDS